jgi:hypothetical protein
VECTRVEKRVDHSSGNCRNGDRASISSNLKPLTCSVATLRLLEVLEYVEGSYG